MPTGEQIRRLERRIAYVIGQIGVGTVGVVAGAVVYSFLERDVPKMDPVLMVLCAVFAIVLMRRHRKYFPMQSETVSCMESDSARQADHEGP